MSTTDGRNRDSAGSGSIRAVSAGRQSDGYISKIADTISQALPISLGEAIAACYDIPPPHVYHRRNKSCFQFCRTAILNLVRQGVLQMSGDIIIGRRAARKRTGTRQHVIDTLKRQRQLSPDVFELRKSSVRLLLRQMKRLGWLDASSTSKQWIWTGPDDASVAELAAACRPRKET